jgi:integrase
MAWARQQKEKGVKLSLTWFEPRSCWKKKVKGEVVYFKFPDSARGYEQALDAWGAWKKEHDQPLDPDGQHERLERMVEWYEVHGEPEGEEGTLAEIRKALASNERMPTRLEITNNYLRGRPVVFEAVREQLDQSGTWNERLRVGSRPSRRRLADYVKSFLENKLAQVNGGVRKPKTYGDLVDRFKAFKAFVGTATLDALDEDLVRRYYNHLIGLKGMAGVRKKNLFRAFQLLVRWLYSEGYLDKTPRNLNSQWEFVEHLKDGHRQVLADKLFTKEEVKSILAKLGPRGRACVLLGLNCGFTPADIAVLRKSEVNLAEGRLVYSRTKTMRARNAPVVNYRLWNITVEALRAVESQSGDLWFTTLKGGPLKTSKVVEGRHIEWSIVAHRWKVWQKSKKVPEKPFKMFRKTGATTIGDSKHRPWVELYLADVPTSIAGKHYDIKSGKIIPELDKALVYLGQQLGLS